MPKPSVACIIPVKDRQIMVLEAIESVFSQDLVPDQVIVIDDESTDDTAQAIKSHFPEIMLIKGSGLGPGGGRNLGAKTSTAEVLMFLDSDDLWMKDHVKKLLEPIDRETPCSFGITINEGGCLKERFTIPGEEFRPNESMESNLFRWCCMVPSSFAIRRETFLQIGGFPKTFFGEDWLFFASLALRIRIRFVSHIVTRRRIHCKNLCWQAFSKELAESVATQLKRLAIDANLTNHAEHMGEVLKIIKVEGHKWKSVQDWYHCMKERGLI